MTMRHLKMTFEIPNDLRNPIRGDHGMIKTFIMIMTVKSIQAKTFSPKIPCVLLPSLGRDVEDDPKRCLIHTLHRPKAHGGRLVSSFAGENNGLLPHGEFTIGFNHKLAKLGKGNNGDRIVHG